MGDVVLFVEDWDSNSRAIWCRICHEEEKESCQSLEAPCACSGTVKFAHRDCIQRWCNEKGNTTCEICLQKYEPGYTATSVSKNSQTVEAAATIRNSLETRRRRENGTPTERGRLAASVDPDYTECSSAADTTASRCRFLALTFTVVLLLKHLFSELSGGSGHHPFPLITVLILKATGIILPMYAVMKAITAIHDSIRQQYYNSYEYAYILDEEDD